jgi:hypothetical protein
MKTNSHIKFTSIFNLIQLHFDSLDLSKVIVDLAKPTLRQAQGIALRERKNIYNCKLQQHQFALRNRRHRSIDWRWQSQLLQWL